MESLTFESDPGMPIIDNTPIYNDATYHEEVVNDGHKELTMESLQQLRTLMILSLLYFRYGWLIIK